MKVLLIGKNGQLGSQIHEQSAQFGFPVISFGRGELDVTNHESVKAKIEELSPKIIIDASAYHNVLDCDQNPNIAFGVNVAASLNIARICLKKNIRLISFSSDKVFDGLASKPYLESDVKNPIQIYGISMSARESVILSYNPNSIVVRTCGIFGGVSGSRSKKGNFVLTILNFAKKNKKMEISSDQTASLANATDLARSVLQLIKQKAGSGIYHLVHEGYGSWAQYAREIVELSKVELEIIPIDRKGAFQDIRIPRFAALENKKAKSLGIRLPSWEDGLAKYIHFLKKEKII